MANYAKRDERKERLLELAARRGDRPPSAPSPPPCWCGEPATLEVSLSTGTRYFCGAHETEGLQLFQRGRRAPR